MIPLTWKCHACGKERPDDKISVVTLKHDWGNGGSSGVNVRYCNDSPDCLEAATMKARVWLAEYIKE